VERSEDRTDWQGSPWDTGGSVDPYGIREVVIEFDNGDSDTFRARLGDEFYSYELQQMATYLETVAGSVRMGKRR
jgi:hypothetical protein